MSDPAEEVVVEAPQSEQEASAALTAGYNKVMGVPAEAPAKPEPQTTEQPVVDDGKKEADEAAAKAAAEKAEQEREKAYLESLPASLKAKLEKLDKIDKIEATANQIGAAQRKLKTVEDRVEAISKAGTDAAKAAAAAGGAAPTQAQIDAAAAVGGEKWKQIKEDFPDWAEAVEERLSALKPGQPQAVDVDGLKREVSESVTTTVRESTAEVRELIKIDAKHPDWEEKVKTPEFKAWHEAQADEVKALSASNKASDAIKMLDAFDAHRKAAAAAAAKSEKNKARLASAVAPQQASSGGPSVLPDEAGLAIGYDRIAKRRA